MQTATPNLNYLLQAMYLSKHGIHNRMVICDGHQRLTQVLRRRSHAGGEYGVPVSFTKRI